MKLGNFVDCKRSGSKIFEVRYRRVECYRIYYGLDDSQLIILLASSYKKTQTRDINRANRGVAYHQAFGWRSDPTKYYAATYQPIGNDYSGSTDEDEALRNCDGNLRTTNC